MTVFEKIAEIGKNFNYTAYIVYTLEGNTGRIVDYTASLNEARSYVKIGRKIGITVYIAEYNPNTKDVCFDVH